MGVYAGQGRGKVRSGTGSEVMHVVMVSSAMERQMCLNRLWFRKTCEMS